MQLSERLFWKTDRNSDRSRLKTTTAITFVSSEWTREVLDFAKHDNKDSTELICQCSKRIVLMTAFRKTKSRIKIFWTRKSLKTINNITNSPFTSDVVWVTPWSESGSAWALLFSSIISLLSTFLSCFDVFSPESYPQRWVRHTTAGMVCVSVSCQSYGSESGLDF